MLAITLDSPLASIVVAAVGALFGLWGIINMVRAKTQAHASTIDEIRKDQRAHGAKLDKIVELGGKVEQMSLRLTDLSERTEGQHNRTSERMLDLTRAVRAMWEHIMRNIEHRGLLDSDDGTLVHDVRKGPPT